MSERAVGVGLSPSPGAATPQMQGSLLSHFWLRYSDTVGTQLLTAGLGMISGLLLPRLLGPQGRGELAAVTVWPITFVFLGSLGMDRASVYFASKGRENPSPVITSCLVLGAAQALLIILAGFVVIPIVLRHYSPGLVQTSLLFLCCAPALAANELAGGVLLGHLETRWYNARRIIQAAVYTAAVIFLFSMKLASVSALVAFQAIAVALAAVLGARVVWRMLRPKLVWDPGLTKAMLRYGLRSQIGRVTYYMNQRLDQLLISLFLPAAVLGIYVAAVAFSDALLIVPRGIGVVTLAVGANGEHYGAWPCAKRSLKLALLWLIPASVGLWVLAPHIIPLFFGARFGPSVLPCRILVFGSCASGLSTILTEAAGSMNRPMIASYAEMVGLGITVVLLVLLLKPYGAVGAAIASSAAYTGTLAFSFYALRRAMGRPTARDFLVVKKP